MSVYKYAIAIMPDESLLEKIKLLELQLANTIGNYPNKNTVTNFTIGEFEANLYALQHIHEQIISACKLVKPFTVTLTTISSLASSNTIYMIPDTNSSKNIKNIATIFNNKLNLYNSFTPHLTIGKNLSLEQIALALQVIKFTPATSTNNSICLKRYNTDSKEYQIINTYTFNK